MERDYMVAERRFMPPARRSFAGPVLLIGAGFLLLTANMGILPEYTWRVLGRFWPMALIIMGVEIMIGRHSKAGSLLSGLLAGVTMLGLVAVLLVSRFVPPVADWVAGRQPLRNWELSEPRATIQQAEVFIDLQGLAHNQVTSLPQGDTLVEARLNEDGEPMLEVDREDNPPRVVLDKVGRDCIFCADSGSETTWEVGLTTQARLDLELETNSGQALLELRELQLEKFTLNSGSGMVNLSLPAGNYEAEIDQGSGKLTLELPDGVGVRVDVDSGSGALHMDERFHLVEGEQNQDSIWETENFDQAEAKITIRLDQGSGATTIE